MTELINSRFLDCILDAAKELNTIEELEAIKKVLDKIKGCTGLITDDDKFNDVSNEIGGMISNVNNIGINSGNE